MKALTLYQPWASFIVAGIKTLETRPNRTGHRGPLVIHAAKLSYWHLIDMIGVDEVNYFDEICREFRMPPVACLQRGAAVGTAEILNCGTIFEGPGIGMGDRSIRWDDKDDGWGTGFVSHREQRLGDFAAGRHAWMMILPRQFETPIPMPGKQGLWNVPDDALVEVLSK